MWLPPDSDYGDTGCGGAAIEKGNGPALELGCGNGRLLVKYLHAGLDVEGTTRPPTCSRSARSERAGGRTCEADAAPRRLGRRSTLGKQYATLYNPAGSFTLFHGREAAVQRVDGVSARTCGRAADCTCRWTSHRNDVRPALQMARPPQRHPCHRRSDVHRARSPSRCDAEHSDVDACMNRHEVWDAERQPRSDAHAPPRNALVDTRRDHAMFESAGYIDVHSEAEADDFIVRGSVAHRVTYVRRDGSLRARATWSTGAGRRGLTSIVPVTCKPWRS